VVEEDCAEVGFAEKAKSAAREEVRERKISIERRTENENHRTI